MARMQYVMDNYDEIINILDRQGVAKRSQMFYNSQGEAAPMIGYAKAIDGGYYVVEAVPNSNKKSLQLESARIIKKRSIRRYVQPKPL